MSETGWQPIATAPKDGTDILVYCGPDSDPMWGVASWLDRGWRMWWSRGGEKHEWPELWQPLPPPPSGE